MSAARLRLAAAAAAACALWALFLKGYFVGFGADSVYYLEPARNFAKGLGVVTRILYPAQIATYPPGLKLPAPFLWHGPLAPMAIGACYRLFDFAPWAPLVYSFGLTLLAGLLIYRLAFPVAGERGALLSAGLFWTNGMILDSDVGALTDPLFIFLITLGAACLWESSHRRSLKWIVGAGLCLGLAACTRLAWQAYWIGFLAAAAWLHPRSLKAPGALLAGLGAGLLPLALYNYSAAGIFFLSPGYYLIQYSRDFPGVSGQTSYIGLSAAQAVLAYPRDVLQKAVTGPLYGVKGFLESSQNPYLSASIFFALLSAFSPEHGVPKFKRFVLILAVPVIVINLLISNGAVHYLQPVFPLLIILATLFIWKFVDENCRPLKRPLLGLAAFAFLFLSPLALQIKDAYKHRAEREQSYADKEMLGAFLKKRTAAGDVLYSDDPPTILWHADRPSVLLTRTLDDARKTFEHLPPDGLVLTSLRVGSEDYDPAWKEALERRFPIMGYEPCAEFSSKTVSAVLFRKPGSCRREG